MVNLEKDQSNNPASSSSNQPNPASGQSAAERTFADEFKSFYKGDFKSIMTLFFTSPIDGIRAIFVKRSHKAYTYAVILFVSVFLLYVAGSYISVDSKFRKYIDFMTFIKIGMVPVIFMLFITLLSFGIKSASGQPVFKTELLTGGLCGIPLGVLFLTLFSLQALSDDTMVDIVRNPEDAGMLALIFLIYIFLMLINVVQQSLKASGTKDSVAWYGSPVVIVMAFYFTFKVIAEGLV
jgi:hypothetical protein